MSPCLRNIAAFVLTIAPAVSGCTWLGRVEADLAARDTPTYLLFSQDGRLRPGMATYLPSRTSNVQIGQIVQMVDCEMEPIEIVPVRNYDLDSFAGGPVLKGIFWDMRVPFESQTDFSEFDFFDLLKRVAPGARFARIEFQQTFLRRFDEPGTFVAFAKRHIGMAIQDEVALLRPCRQEVLAKNYRFVDHLLTAELRIRFYTHFMLPHCLSPDSISPPMRDSLANYGLRLDESTGALVTSRQIPVARTGQLQINEVGRFGPAPPSPAKGRDSLR